MNETLEAHARATDPTTSHEAAHSISEKLRPKQEAVLQVFKASGPMTLEVLVRKYKAAVTLGIALKQSDSGIRTRASELVAQGKVYHTGEYKLTASGRRAIVWAAVTGDLMEPVEATGGCEGWNGDGM